MPVVEITSSDMLMDTLRNEEKEGYTPHDKEYVFVDFYATWCGPCRRIAPRLDEFSETYGNKVLFAKVNIEECQEVAMAYGVTALPTFVIFDKGSTESSYQPIVGANVAVIESRLKELTSESSVSDKISDDF